MRPRPLWKYLYRSCNPCHTNRSHKLIRSASDHSRNNARQKQFPEEKPALFENELLNKTNSSAQPYWPGQTWDMSCWKEYHP